MTRAGKRQTQKRASAPSRWPVERKSAGQRWVPKIRPGPHDKESSMPLLTLLRDVLNVGMTKTEITRVLTGRKIKIDGRIRSDERFPVGHMDVVELIDENKFFRVQIHNSHRILPFEIEEDDSQFKICKVIGKRNVRGGHTQISLHDGRNILLDKDDDRIEQIKGQYSLKIALPSQEILEIYPLEEEARAMVTEGRHQGKVGKIMEITRRYGPNASEVIFEDENNSEEPEFRTALDYVFVVGPEIDLHTGEVNE